MNNDSTQSRFESQFRSIADQACREFRSEFEQEPNLRIELFSATLQKWTNSFDNEIRAKARNILLAELIHVELELRLIARQIFDLEEYSQRFPGFSPAINLALEKIKRTHPSLIPKLSLTRVTLDRTAVDRQITHEGDRDFTWKLDRSSKSSVPQRLGRFHEIVPFSSGGFGTVCRAIDSQNGNVVALKFPRNDKLREDADLLRFVDEARNAMRLSHPSIVKTFSIEEGDGYLAIVQQFIDGWDLRQYAKDPLPQIQIAELTATVADALAYAHGQGILHRDIKPGNILIDRDGKPYLADFGLALHERDQLLISHQRCGTIYYMPPEMVAALTRRLDGRSDIWSLGVVLYELLTGRKPFEGVTEDDVFDQIENDDPRPPRQLDSSIDRELQRITLKCLERQQRNRYATADELADDLRQFLNDPRAVSSPAVVPTLIPKGLQSYDAEDADFFLDLLPGSRDRNGLPKSLRFWQQRFNEPVLEINRMPLGVLFGPSGSGKSSFVKAGLLPLLNIDIDVIYLEANQSNTETRLRTLLKKRCPQAPPEISLSDLCHLISLNPPTDQNSPKILIVLDQFEQRLSLSDSWRTTELVKALRYCDGERLQCLLLVRDDFLMGLSRFMDALEIDFRQGDNAQAIDLFDRQHAKTVLIKLGRAFGQLPNNINQLTTEQLQFIDAAVDQLANGDYVICVHLALFAEMFRYLPWQFDEFQADGGVVGTGERYLSASFGSAARDKRLPAQLEPAQRILEVLLPAATMDIRGAAASRKQLAATAGLDAASTGFQDLMNALEDKLKLITRVDPDLISVEKKSELGSSDSQIWYQLTHDYLVPSIRSWLGRSLRKTRTGRARLRLQDVATYAIPQQPIRLLPTNVEWLAWRFLIPWRTLTPNEIRVMMAAGSRFWRQAGMAAVVLASIGLVAGWGWNRYQTEQLNRQVDNLIYQLVNNTNVREIPATVKQISQHRLLAEPKLKQQFTQIDQDPSTDSSQQALRLTMGLFPFNPHQAQVLGDSVLPPTCGPLQLQMTIELLSQYPSADLTSLLASWQPIYSDVRQAPSIRLRAICAHMLQNQHQGDWSPYSEIIISALWDEPASTIEDWFQILKPAGKRLIDRFEHVFTLAEDDQKAFLLVSGIYQFSDDPKSMFDFLIERVESGHDAQKTAIVSIIKQQGASREFAAMLKDRLDHPLDDRRQVTRRVALLNLGMDQPIVEVLKQDFEVPQTLLAIKACGSQQIDLYRLLALYQNHSVASFENLNLRRSLLQSLAFHANNVFDFDLRKQLTEIAQHHVQQDPDACCFSTAELILHRLDPSLSTGSKKTWRQSRRDRDPDGVAGNVWIDHQLNAYSIVTHETSSGQELRFAIMTNELTWGQIQEFLDEKGVDFQPKKSDDPYTVNGLIRFEWLQQYCNWLNKKNSITESEYCYRVVEEEDKNERSYFDQVQADLTKTGLRIPTLQEWTCANQSNLTLQILLGDESGLIHDYAWSIENGRAAIQPVGRLLPNAAGLFDSFGNLQELIQDEPDSPTGISNVGMTVRAQSSAFSIDRTKKIPAVIGPNIGALVGVRLVRRFP